MEQVEKTLTFTELWSLYIPPYKLVKIYLGTDTTNCVYFAQVEDMPVSKYFRMAEFVVMRIYACYSDQTGAYLCIHLKGDETND